MKDSQQQLSFQTRFLHWVVAFGMIVLVGVGWYMSEAKDRSLYGVHKSVGMLLLVFIVWRLVWRLRNGMPQPVSQQSAALNTLAHAVHWVLLIATVAFPLSGMVMSAMSGNGLSFFGLEILANNPDLANPGRNLPLNRELAGMARNTHGVLLWITASALVLHVVGALKHHIIDKDGTLKRMQGKPF